MKNRTLAVSVLTHNAETTIAPLVQSILRQTRRADEVFVVDNGSTDRTTVVAQRAGVEVLQLPNSGVGAGHSEAIHFALITKKCDLILLLEHDVVLADTCLENLLIGASAVSARQFDRTAFGCETLHPTEDAERLARADDGGLAVSLSRVHRKTFNGLLLSWPVVERVGLPRSDFFVGQEDNDYSDRMQRSGIDIQKVWGACLGHSNKGQLRRGEQASDLRLAYSLRNSTYRDALSAAHYPRACARAVVWSLRSVVSGGTIDLGRCARDGFAGRLGRLADHP